MSRAWREWWEYPHFVYRAYDASGVLLYVGLSSEPERRIRQHAKHSAWFADAARFTTVEHPDYDSAKAAERQAIRAEAPRYNICCQPSARAREARARLRSLLPAPAGRDAA